MNLILLSSVQSREELLGSLKCGVNDILLDTMILDVKEPRPSACVSQLYCQFW
jgi:hypothetical protein